MKVPDKIYLQVCMECNQEDCENCRFEDIEASGEITWCCDRIWDNDKVYVSKDALYEWAMQKKTEALSMLSDVSAGMNAAFDMLIHELNSL